MELFCPECGVPVPTEKVNAQGMVAFCPACDTLFSFDSKASRVQSKAKHQAAGKPEALEVIEDHDQVMMSYRSFRWLEAIFMAPFTLFWNAVVFGAIAIFLSSDWRPFAPLLIIPAGVTLWMLYELLCLSFNRTKILLTPAQVKVYHRPFRAQGGVSIPVQEIKQVYCKHLPNLKHQKQPFRLNPSTNRHYELHAVLKNAGDIVLLGTDEEDVARFIGQRIRQHLRLEGILPFKDANGKALS